VYGPHADLGSTATSIDLRGATLAIHSTDRLLDLESTATFATDGSLFSLSFVCPQEAAGTSRTFGHTASGSTLTFFDDAKQTITVFSRR